MIIPESLIDIALNSDACLHPIEKERLIEALRTVLSDHGITRGDISLAVVNDATIHALNRQYLEHDYPTDVLSFLLEREGDHLEGEIIVSADHAATRAKEIGWPFDSELLLYVIHGALHLVGFLDHSASEKEAMRAEEKRQLARWGIVVEPSGENSMQPQSPAVQGEGEAK